MGVPLKIVQKKGVLSVTPAAVPAAAVVVTAQAVLTEIN